MVDMPTVVKTVRIIAVVKMVGRVMKTELVKMLEGPMMVGGQNVAKEEGVAVTWEVVAVMGEVVAVTGEVVAVMGEAVAVTEEVVAVTREAAVVVVVVVTEMMGVVVEVVKEAKEVEEEENQEAMEENPLAAEVTQRNCLEQVLWSYLNSDVVNPFQKNHL